MTSAVKIISIGMLAGVLAFAIFGIGMYFYADNMFNQMFGGHLHTDYDTKQKQINELEKKSQALLDDVRSTN